MFTGAYNSADISQRIIYTTKYKNMVFRMEYHAFTFDKTC